MILQKILILADTDGKVKTSGILVTNRYGRNGHAKITPGGKHVCKDCGETTRDLT